MLTSYRIESNKNILGKKQVFDKNARFLFGLNDNKSSFHLEKHFSIF